jgi:diguanylate cyclase (GGDEF)-like protein
MSAPFRQSNRPGNLSAYEARKLVEPALLSVLFLSFYLIVDGLQKSKLGEISGQRAALYGCLTLLMVSGLYLVILRNPSRYARYQNLFSVVNAGLLGAGLWLLPANQMLVVYAILLLTTILFATLWERSSAFIFLFLSVSISVPIALAEHSIGLQFLLNHGSFLMIGVILTETISRLTRIMRARIERLEIINDFARQIGASLEADEVIEIVNNALQKAIRADSYYLGSMDGDQLHLKLLYDDGEYFSGMKLPIEGSLSGWVIEHSQPLFMPDMRQETDLEGVRLIIVGQERTSLSWMGVPMITPHIRGILAVASYQPNAFSRTDMELLETLGQQAALALSNAYHHNEVERQARLDSLTQVYNHGYFLKVLEKEAAIAQQTSQRLGLIMLDIDYFKQYNDSYGHLAGDLVLVSITQIITNHIHESDAVGRWGGEEFAVLFPATSGPQVYQIARRIQKKVNQMNLSTPDGRQLPLPTVSQGIAVYPDETDQVMSLIDLADQRLYIAKQRGRNQIEPSPEHWAKIETH